MTDRDRRELTLRLLLGPSLIVAKGYEATEVGANFEAARTLAARLDHPFVTAFAHIISCFVYYRMSKPEALLDHADTALTILAEHEIPVWRPEASLHRGYALLNLGRLEAGIGVLEQDGFRASIETGSVLSLDNMIVFADSLLLMGRIDDGLDVITKAIATGDRME